MKPQRIQRETTTVDALRLDPTNPRQRTARGRDLIVRSLKDYGATRSIVLDEKDMVLAGNGVVDAAMEAGITKVRIIEALGDEIIAVRRRGLSEEQKHALAIADNRTSELAEWNVEQLRADLKAGLDLQPFFFDEELRVLLSTSAKAGLTDPDHVPKRRATGIVTGDLFELGQHRLLCGDATRGADVARLMADQRAMLFATDPPYAVGYQGGSHPSTRGNQGALNKDKDWSQDYVEASTDADGRTFYAAFVKTAVDVALAPTAAWYCWHASRRQAMLEDVWREAGAFVHQQIIWVKSRPVLTYSVYLWAHEPCLFGWQQGKKPRCHRKLDPYPTTVWSIPNTEVESKDHPTSKPVRLFALPIEMHTANAAVCYEPFSGSGTQIVAAEQLGRRCFAVEISPTFVQVAIDRWEAFTGQKARKVGDARAAATPRRRRKA